MDSHARRAKRSLVMVKLLHRIAEPALAVGRLVNGVPVIEKVWGLRAVSNELWEVHTTIGLN